jgi:hypothetical protein
MIHPSTPRRPLRYSAALLLLLGGLLWRQGAVAALDAAPADPAPGSFLSTEGADTRWVTLTRFDRAARAGKVRAGDGMEVEFRLLPYTSVRRFGSPGSPLEELRAGDTLRLRLARPGGAGPWYALEIADPITDQVEKEYAFQVSRLDRDARLLTVEKIDTRDGKPLGEQRVLRYGKGTLLVLNEDPVYLFNVAPGTRLWINTSTVSGQVELHALEVLDAASSRRFRGQQWLRAVAAAETRGAPGYLDRDASGASVIRVFPDFARWAADLKPGDRLTLREPGRPSAERAAATLRGVTTGANQVTLVLSDALATFPPRSVVVAAPQRSQLSYPRDIRPMLEVNCGGCHRDGRAASGLSVSTPAALHRGGRRGPGIVLGKPGESMVYLTMAGEQNPRMPPDRDATPEQLALLKRWIEAGAPVD